MKTVQRIKAMWRKTSIEIKVGIIAATSTILAAIIPLIFNVDIRGKNLQVAIPTSRPRIIDIETKAFSIGKSVFSVIDLKLENPSNRAIRITNIEIEVERSFQFDVPKPAQLRIPISASYHVSLANLFPNDKSNINIFHEIRSNSAERIAIVSGSSGLTLLQNGEYQREDPSYLSRVRVIFYNGSELVFSSEPLYLLVIAQDSGTQVGYANENLQAKIESDNLPTMDKSMIRNTMMSFGLQTPEWFENDN